MAKEVVGQIKLQIRGEATNSSPPVGPVLGSKGIDIVESCKQFNAKAQDKAGKMLPVVITYYVDKSFDFVVRTPPATVQSLEAAKKKSGSAQLNRVKITEITWDQVKAITEDKLADLNCFTAESATRVVAGTIRSMGITVKETFPGNN